MRILKTGLWDSDGFETDPIRHGISYRVAGIEEGANAQVESQSVATDPPVDEAELTTIVNYDAKPGQTFLVQREVPANPSLSDEVTFISGINPDGTLALYSAAAWNGDHPATFDGGYTGAGKWFADSSADTAGTPGGTVTYAFDPASGWTVTEQVAFVAGLSLWSAVANISFVQASDYATAGIQFTRGNDGGAHTRLHGSTPFGGGVTNGTTLLQITQATISIDTSVPGFGPIQPLTATSNNIFTNFGGYAMEAILHEEGHALGLDHAGPYPVSDGTASDSLQYGAYDNRQWSIMSYIDPWDTAAPFYSQNPGPGTSWGAGSNVSTDGHVYRNVATTPMLLDILAIQRLYGVPASTPLSGGQTFGNDIVNLPGSISPFFDFHVNQYGILTIWDAGVGNTLDLHNTSGNSVLSLSAGTFSSFSGRVNNLAIAYDTRIDKLLAGAGNDTIIGNNYGDYVDGGLGADTIYGGDGNDTLYGGLGNYDDLIYGGAGANTIDGGGGFDTAGYSLPMSDYSIVENGDDTVAVMGNGLIDTLKNVEALSFAGQTVTLTSLHAHSFLGGPGDDLFFATPGDDTVDGGPGTDTLSFANSKAGVKIDMALTTPQHTGGSGDDQIQNIESIIGSPYDDVINGGFGDDFISGGTGGSDQLSGGGGGTDTLNYADDAGGVSLSISDTLGVGGEQGGLDGPKIGLVSFRGFEVYVTGKGDDLIVANDRDNTLIANGGKNQVRALRGNDFVQDSGVGSSLDGGPGTDRLLLYRTTSPITGTLAMGGSGTLSDGSTISNFERMEIYTGAGGDNLTLTKTLQSGSGDLAAIWFGGGGIDTAQFAGRRADYVITQSGDAYTIAGFLGTDTLADVEYAQFDDQTVRLLPGSGATLTPGAAPSSYMAAIRDFDGNNLAGQGTQVIDPATGGLVAGGAWDGVSGWTLAGSADISGNGTTAQILFNNLIGRWAEVTTESDGKVYFDNHGWAGDTRIVGIYVDPEVSAGHAVQGGPDDSQRRFQNDLFIGNIKAVLGAGDFNHDGFQEVYFSLTDGTAYLHAIMWNDGNIQYANYQSAQQVQDYLGASGVSPSTWGGWLQEAPAVAVRFAPAAFGHDSNGVLAALAG